MRRRSLALLLAFSVAVPAGRSLALEKGQEDLLALARKSTQELLSTLKGVLQKELRENGPSGAIEVCAKEAPRLLKEIQTRYGGLYIRRTTLKPRNSANAPTEDEKALLLKLQALAEKDSLPEEVIDTVEIQGQKMFRYARTLRIGPMCMICHGTERTIPQEVRAVLAQRYPNDQATGYRPGDFRGIVVVKIPLKQEEAP